MKNSLLEFLFSLALEGVYVTIDSTGQIHFNGKDQELQRPPASLTGFDDIPNDLGRFIGETNVPFMLYPTTSLQLSLLYECQLRPKSTSYQINAPIRFVKHLEIERVTQSFQLVINRHAALRTTFRQIDNRYLQYIPRIDQAQIVMHELSSASDTAIEKARAVDVTIPVDITQKSHVLYVYIFQGKAVACTLVVHHAVGDLPSAAILMMDWVTLFSDQNAFEFEDPYIPFVQEQINNETGGLAERNRKYWLERLTPLPTPTELPTDFARSSFFKHNSADYSFKVEGHLRTQLKTLAERLKTDEITILLLVYQIFIARYTGNWDTTVTLVTPTSARRKFPAVIGYGVQDVPLRVELDRQASLLNLVAANRPHRYQLFKHRDISLMNLASDLKLNNDQSRAAISQVSFIAYPEKGLNPILREISMCTMGYTSNVITYGDVNVQFAPVQVPHWPYELSLISGCHSDGFLPLVFRYNTTLFTCETIERIARNYLTLLNAAINQPEVPVNLLQLLSEVECHQLNEWGENPRPVDYMQMVPDRFETQAAATPHAIALIIGHHQVTYAELNQQSNAIAHHLQTAYDVQVETPVGLLFHPSVEMIASIFGVFKAGGAFVPIDPDIPRRRVKHIVESAEIKIVLSHQSISDECLPPELAVIDTPHLISKLESSLLGDPPRTLKPEHLAYIYFTSGSTGIPKGVMIQHNSFLASQLSWNQSPGVAPDDKVLSIYNYAFDASLTTNVAPLLTGACVVLASREERQDPRLLSQLMERHVVTSMCATTSHYRLLKLGGWKGMPQLKAASAGEAFSEEIAAFLLDRCHSVWNAYGPTEASNIVSTYQLMTSESPIPIGAPAANARLYILDEQRRPVPIGVRGELYIGGVYVGRGYINQPEMTAERYVPDPFGDQPKSLMYRTGDIASFRRDGLIQFHGRNDTQVKIRGYRIETEEIEQTINQFPGIRDAVVRPFQLKNELTGLAAYIVHANPQAKNCTDVRDFLKNKLPPYMVPDAFIIIDKLQLNPSGKLDASALPDPLQGRIVKSEDDAGYESSAKFTQNEPQIRKIWESILQHRDFGPEDSFFEVGGDSLSMMIVVLEVERLTGLRLPMASIIRAATIRDLARVVRKIASGIATDHPLLVPIKMSGNATPIFAITAGFGDLIAFQKWVDHLPEQQPFYVLQPPTVHTPELSAAELAGLYLNAVRSVQREGPYRLFGYSIGGLLAYEMAHQLGLVQQEVDRLVLLETPVSYPAQFERVLEWLGKILGDLEKNKDTKNFIKALAKDEGWRTHFNAVKKYPPPRYHGDVTIIITALSKSYLRPGRWKRFIEGNLKIEEAPGNHHTIVRNHADVVLAMLR